MTNRIAYLPLETYPEVAPDAAIQAAVAVATALGCKVQASAFAVTIPPVTSSPLGGFLINAEGMAKAAEDRSRDTCARLKTLIEGAAKGASVTVADTGLGGTLEQATAEARYFDLAVLPWTGEAGVAQDMAQALIFGAGVPVVLAPAGAKAGAVNHLAIAWDESRAAARALTDALPLLAPGGRITVLTVHDEKALSDGGLSARLAAALRARGLQAEAVDLSAKGKPVAEALQDGAVAAGAGLLAMGGFGHSRLRDFILGGATKGVLADLRLPVLLSH